MVDFEGHERGRALYVGSIIRELPTIFLIVFRLY